MNTIQVVRVKNTKICKLIARNDAIYLCFKQVLKKLKTSKVDIVHKQIQISNGASFKKMGILSKINRKIFKTKENFALVLHMGIKKGKKESIFAFTVVFSDKNEDDNFTHCRVDIFQLQGELPSFKNKAVRNAYARGMPYDLILGFAKKLKIPVNNNNMDSKAKKGLSSFVYTLLTQQVQFASKLL